MNTPPPVLRLDDTEQPPNGQHGPDSGINARNAHDGTTEAVKAPEVFGSAPEPPASISSLSLLTQPPISLGCARQPCGGSLENVDPRHIDNLKGVWVCDDHRGGDTA